MNNSAIQRPPSGDNAESISSKNNNNVSHSMPVVNERRELKYNILGKVNSSSVDCWGIALMLCRVPIQIQVVQRASCHNVKKAMLFKPLPLLPLRTQATRTHRPSKSLFRCFLICQGAAIPQSVMLLMQHPAVAFPLVTIKLNQIFSLWSIIILKILED